MRLKIAGALGGALVLAALTAGSAHAGSWGATPENRDMSVNGGPYTSHSVKLDETAENRDMSVNGGPYVTHSVALDNPTPIG